MRLPFPAEGSSRKKAGSVNFGRQPWKTEEREDQRVSQNVSRVLSESLLRIAMYRAGWEMFLEKPVFGWGIRDMQAELASRVEDFHQEEFFLHNTYLEILVQHGLLGIALYLWIVVDLVRLGRHAGSTSLHGQFLDRGFQSIWVVLVLVYLVNASFVVMNYQFVNGLLFTVAGMLAARNRQLQAQLIPVRSAY